MKPPFETTHKGKCDTCSIEKTLDSMVIKDYTKGLYECVDCKVDKEKHLEDRSSLFYWIGKQTQLTRVQKLIGWLTG